MEALVMAYLKLENVHKNFPGHQALRGINLTVEKGETLAIIGPSGCGKTTLLRCLALLETIDDGAIHLDGSPVVTMSVGKPQIHVDQNAYRAKNGFVFQNLNIWPHLSVLENLTLAPKIVRNSSPAQAIEKAGALLAQMGIYDKKESYPAALSGGQLQRVALARSLMMDPDILLLDEITSALDPELVGDILDIIAKLSESGMTMLIVTHEMSFAAEVADRVVFIDEGTVVEEGEPKELFENPQTTRLNSFIARMLKYRTLNL